MRTTRNAFTLIELGVILAVVAMAMAYVAPDFMEMAGGELATRSAKEMATIADAAKWFYHNESGTPMDRNRLRWPGEGLGAAGGDCSTPGSPSGQLTAAGYLRAADLVNPWGYAYDLSLVSAGVGDHTCKFIIASNVPVNVAPQMKTYMPMTVCDGTDGAGACPGAAPGGFDRCCAKIVRPGQEAILQEWIESGTMCNHMLGGQVDASGECDTRARWDYGSCYDTTDANHRCGNGYVAVGSKRVGCGKYCHKTYLRCCKGLP